ncbi:MAG: glycosyltransferase family 4 protein, partial [Steroidobacteraceae bacterium]
GVSVTRLPSVKGWRGAFANRLSLAREVRCIATDGPIDVLEAPDFEGATAGLPRCSRLRVVRLHGSHRYFSDERGIRHSRSIGILEKLALQKADALVSVSHYTARRTRTIFDLHREITTIHNAVSIVGTYPIKFDYRARQRVVYFGTLAEKKGVLVLAEAWQHFHESHPNWRLSLFGRDAQHAGRSVKEMMIDLLGPAIESVEFIGYLPGDEVLTRLANFDFVILPSFSESFGLATLEAMALGMPVIFSVLSSGPELIKHGIDGWLCDPRSIQSVEASLTLAAGSADARERVGQAARSTVDRRFSYEAFVDQNIAFYRSQLAKRGLHP